MLAQLDTKTVYSFMDSTVTIEKYVSRAKELGYTHLGIMDSNSLYAAFGFMEMCHKAGISPIIGCEVELEQEGISFRLQMVALTSHGYQQLLKISTLRMLGEKQLEAYFQYFSDVALILPYKEYEKNLRLDFDYYIGVYGDTPVQGFPRPILPLYTVRYFDESDRETLQVLHAIRDNTSLNEVGELAHHQQLLPPEKLEEVFAGRFPEALVNLSQLVQGISYQINRDLKLPRFNREKEAVVELQERAQAGLVAKGLTASIYQERLNKELGIIHQMGFDDYFLIVWDLLRFGRSQGYYMGMGRGSAVGSLVAYSLEITGIDPVKHGLLFERFLNEERYSMPDIDIDIPDIYRGEFIRYVRERYGSYHSAQIVTYSTFGAKQAIRDVFKRFGTPEYELTNITKKISFRDNLHSAYERNASFRQLINSKPEYQKAFSLAQAIEGQPRQTSIHAAGVVMSDADLTDCIPLKQGEDMYITQYDAHAVEANGLLKMDFLGLRNLTFVQKMKEAVAEKYGKTIVIEEIDLEDKQTLSLFAKGLTKGIFQFEQPGAIALLKRVQPASFEEVVATTSLNRPGASDYSDNFVNRKHQKEAVDLLDSSIASILEPTYGIMLYQEQVMQIAQVYAGFTLGKADLLRRAMSKKNAAEMQKMEAAFLMGATQLGHDPEKAKHIFAMMAKFAGYGFNRSHAYAYSALAFQLAYFKAHYPDVFFDIMLNFSSSDYITDALQFGFEVASLSINSIPYHDKFDQGRIFMGLKNIKGLPREFAFWVMEERPFKSVEDFVLRLPAPFKKVELLTPLVQLGLFDLFDKNRKKIISNLENLFVFADAFGSFFAEEEYSWAESDDYADLEKYEMEQAIIGVGLSPHPLLQIAKESAKSFLPIADLVEGERVTILVQIQQIRQIRTKKTGELMAFLQVTDTKKRMDVTLFPETYQKYMNLLSEGVLCYLSGKVQERDGHLQLILDDLELASSERFWILVKDQTNDAEIAAMLGQFPGSIPVILHYQNTNQTVRVQGFSVQKSEELQNRLCHLSVKTVFR
ncbi:DNA polymerase III subunit alpha [Streptococcus cameli]